MASALQLIFCTLFLSLTSQFSTLTSAQQTLINPTCVGWRGYYTLNSTFSTNLKNLLSSISTLQQNDYGFYNLSVGETTNDKVNAIGLCRGDKTPPDCIECLKEASSSIIKSCPNQTDAVIWYEACMLRYSNRSIFHTMENEPWLYYKVNSGNISDQDGFNSTLIHLLDTLRSRAASSVVPQRKYASGNITATDSRTIFGLVQCTPDLSEADCNDCLLKSFAQFRNKTSLGCCYGKQGATVVFPSCNFRFDTESFFEPEPEPEPKPEPKPEPEPESSPPFPKGNENNTSKVVIIIVVSVVGFFMLIISVYIFLRRRKRNPKETTQSAEEMLNVESLQYDFTTIRKATDDFSEANKLGQGGFGVVYQGRLPDGEEIAVKRLSTNSPQGDIEFKNEVLLLAKLQHRSLVRLLGFCLEGHERILIYEFVPNASLDQFIFDSVQRKELNWERRFKIIVGIARGLVYLHEDSRLRIIHRDLKASNILLDSDMNPKIADFGMARMFSMDQTQGATSRIVGTYGYMAPEYALHGHFSVKSDVFSFGVLVLEIMSGQKNNNFRIGETLESLLSYAWIIWREGNALNLVDPCLTNGSRSEMMRCIRIGLLCVQENASNRPTMASVLLMLNSFSVTLPIPSTPAFFLNSTTESGVSLMETNSDDSGKQTVNEASITDPYPR